MALLLLLAYPQLGAWPLVIALAPWLVRIPLCRQLVQRTRFDVPMVLFLLTAALSVWASYDRQTSWNKFSLIAGGVLLFYALANSGFQPITMAWLATGAGVALAVYFMLTNDWSAQATKAQIITTLGQRWQSLRLTLPGPRLNPNEVGGILAMFAPFAAWVSWHTWHQATRLSGTRDAAHWVVPLAAASSLFLILVGLLMSVSRGAWLALAVSVLVAGAWCLASRSGRHRSTSQRGPWMVLLILVATAALLAIFSLKAGEFFTSGLFNIESLLARTQFHRYSLLLALDYPLIGAGLDGFQMLYSTYALLIHVGFIAHSHNLFLSLAIDQGLPGLFALLWMWGAVASTAWKATRSTATGLGRTLPPELGVAALSVIVILVHGFVETALYGQFVFLLFVPLAFAALAPAPRREVSRRLRPRPWMVGLAVLAMPVLLWPGKSMSLFYANLGAVHQSQAELSVYSWPEWPLQDAVRRAVNLDPAIHAFERALALNQANSTANRRLGMIELSLGEYEDALRHLRLAYAAEPWSTTTRQLLGEALIVNGYQDEGETLWADVNNEQAQLEARRFWYGYIADAEREAAVRHAARGQ